MTKLEETIIISPTYNELDNAQVLIPAIFHHLPGVTLMIVDDSSPDGTSNEIRRMQKFFPNLLLHSREGKLGLGSAYRDAFNSIMQNDKYKHIVTMDADFSHDFREIPAMVEKTTDADFVVGSRYVPGGRIENWSTFRRVLSKFANLYVRSILRVHVRDMTTGFACFKKDILNGFDLSSFSARGFAFLVELKYKVLLKEYKIIEFPIVFTERRKGKSKLSAGVVYESFFVPWRLIFQKNRI
ncbi:MAG: polyprenol monophosphomannose synthase [bacterium]|nr:polyprenol monophosphomannose synthase [bacterium]